MSVLHVPLHTHVSPLWCLVQWEWLCEISCLLLIFILLSVSPTMPEVTKNYCLYVCLCPLYAQCLFIIFGLHFTWTLACKFRDFVEALAKFLNKSDAPATCSCQIINKSVTFIQINSITSLRFIL